MAVVVWNILDLFEEVGTEGNDALTSSFSTSKITESGEESLNQNTIDRTMVMETKE